MTDVRTGVLAGLAERMQHLSRRTSVLAENIANADTPGFVARDLAEPRAQTSPALRVSDARHIAHAGAAGSARIVPAPDGDASINGNEVSLETQMMKLAQTRSDYQLASSVYRKGLELIRLAVSGGR